MGAVNFEKYKICSKDFYFVYNADHNGSYVNCLWRNVYSS